MTSIYNSLDKKNINTTKKKIKWCKKINDHIIHGCILWMLGLLNNFSYVVIFSSIQPLAVQFEALHLIGLIEFSNIGLGIFSKLLHILYLYKYSYRYRVILIGILSIFGFILIQISFFTKFSILIFGILLLGASSSMGESVIMCYIDDYHKKYNSYWSSGTGGAGILGALSVLIFHKYIDPIYNNMLFLILLPTSFIYVYIFFILDSICSSCNKSDDSIEVSNSSSSPSSDIIENIDTFIISDNSDDVNNSNTINNNNSDIIYKLYEISKNNYKYFIQIITMYFCEYSIIVTFVSKSNPAKEIINNTTKNSSSTQFEILLL